MCEASRILQWSPADTLVLSRHVQQHGTRNWAAPASQLGVAPAHCMLKWHVLRQLYQQGPMLPAKSKRYTDWELCVLLVGYQASRVARMTRRETHEALASWLPGRTAEGVKQAINAHILGHEHTMLMKLRALKLPAVLPDLLQLWPDLSQLPCRPLEEEQACAAEIMTALAAMAQHLAARQGSSSSRVAGTAVAAAAAATAESCSTTSNHSGSVSGRDRDAGTVTDGLLPWVSGAAGTSSSGGGWWAVTAAGNSGGSNFHPQLAQQQVQLQLQLHMLQQQQQQQFGVGGAAFTWQQQQRHQQQLQPQQHGEPTTQACDFNPRPSKQHHASSPEAPGSLDGAAISSHQGSPVVPALWLPRKHEQQHMPAGMEQPCSQSGSNAMAAAAGAAAAVAAPATARPAEGFLGLLLGQLPEPGCGSTTALAHATYADTAATLSAGMDEDGEAAEQTDEVLQQLLAFEAEQQQQWLQDRPGLADYEIEGLYEQQGLLQPAQQQEQQQQQQQQRSSASDAPWQLHALRTPTSTELPEGLPTCLLHASVQAGQPAGCQLVLAAQQPVQHGA